MNLDHILRIQRGGIGAMDQLVDCWLFVARTLVSGELQVQRGDQRLEVS